MKKLLFMVCAAALTVGCQNGDLEIIGGGEGSIAITASTSGDIQTKADGENGVQVATPALGEFSLLITGDVNGFSKSWASISDYNSEDERFVSGAYTVAIEWGDINEEGYSKPYFYGEVSAAVPDRNKTIDVEVVATVGNAIVEIATTENFRGYFPTRNFTLTTASNTFELSEEPTEHLFIAPQANVALDCTCIRQSNLAAGKQESLATQYIPEVKARTRYIVTYDLEKAGNVTVTVKLDDTLIGSEEIDVELNENA
ncbi:MAG: DUF4493 domain-containing protein [Alistipes sp.]|nr:DUF4493 domain-containing protein [Alistipes sp.]